MELVLCFGCSLHGLLSLLQLGAECRQLQRLASVHKLAGLHLSSQLHARQGKLLYVAALLGTCCMDSCVLVLHFSFAAVVMCLTISRASSVQRVCICIYEYLCKASSHGHVKNCLPKQAAWSAGASH